MRFNKKYVCEFRPSISLTITSQLVQWWPNYGPQSFIIWPAKVFYIIAPNSVSKIFYTYAKKKIEKLKNTVNIFHI